MMLASAGIQALSSGTAVFANGELEVAYRVPFHRVWEATQSAMREMQFEIEDARIRTETKALLFAEELSGRSTTVSVVSLTPMVTQVRIRVGFIGDQSLSRLIMDRIESRMADLERELGPANPEPMPPVEPYPSDGSSADPR